MSAWTQDSTAGDSAGIATDPRGYKYVVERSKYTVAPDVPGGPTPVVSSGMPLTLALERLTSHIIESGKLLYTLRERLEPLMREHGGQTAVPEQSMMNYPVDCELVQVLTDKGTRAEEIQRMLLSILERLAL